MPSVESKSGSKPTVCARCAQNHTQFLYILANGITRKRLTAADGATGCAARNGVVKKVTLR